MAGTITVSTISDGTNSTSSTNCIQGSAKAWVNFNGTTATPSTIRGSYNVTSVTKNGTGDYTINFTNAIPNANYATITNVQPSDANCYTANVKQSTTPTTTAVNIRVVTQSATLTDATGVYAAIFD